MLAHLKTNSCFKMIKTPTSALLKALTRGAAAGERHGPLLGRQRDHSHNLGLGGRRHEHDMRELDMCNMIRERT